MFLRNKSQYPDAEIRRLVQIGAQEFDHRAVCINLKNIRRGAFRGRAYGKIPEWDYWGHERRSNAPKSAKYLVVVAVGDAKWFPCNNLHTQVDGTRVPYGGAKSPLIEYRSWQEAVVAVTAHELNHIRQMQNKMPMAEYRCELAAARALERYRAMVAAEAGEETGEETAVEVRDAQ